MAKKFFKQASLNELKVGDKVFIKNIDHEDVYDGFIVTPLMASFAGKEVTVSKVLSDSVKIEEDKSTFYYPPSVLEIAVKKVKAPKKKAQIIEKPLIINTPLAVTKIVINEPHVVVFYIDENGEERKSVAQCLPEDEFNAELGLKVAIMKALKKMTERFLKKV